MKPLSVSEILDGIRSWVEIESPTRDADGVNRVMTRAAEDFSAAGARVTRIGGHKGFGDHLRIASPWGGNGPGILVLCHLDTVHPTGTLAEQLRYRVEGDRAFGPGIFDMKGGRHLAFAAFRAICAAGRTTPLPIRFLYSSDEETGSETSRALIEEEARNSKYVLVTEPARNGGKCVTGRKGVGQYRIRTRGRPAHAGGWHQDGRSTVLEMARPVIAIEGMTDYRRGITLNVGQIHGGTADNVVPEHCCASIDMRIATIADAAEMDVRLKSLRPCNPAVDLEVTGGLNRPPFEKNDGIEHLLKHAQALAREIGFDLSDTQTGGGSDGNFTAHKVPTLDGLGVDGDGAHTLHEHLLVSSIVPRMMLQQRLFETLQ